MASKTARAKTALAEYVVPALKLLPAKMGLPQAQLMLLAIGLQESDFLHTTQIGGGPARGYWQFEKLAVQDVLTRAGSKAAAKRVCDALHVSADTDSVYGALAGNHVLAAAFARLNLFNDPHPMPATEVTKKGSHHQQRPARGT